MSTIGHFGSYSPAEMAIGNCTVCIIGILKPDGNVLPPDIIRMHFENPRHGGRIAQVELKPAENRAWITFEDSKSVALALTKTNHCVMGFNVMVVLPDNIRDAPEAGAVPATALGHQVNVHSIGSMHNPMEGASSLYDKSHTFGESKCTSMGMDRMSAPSQRIPAEAGLNIQTYVLIENVPPNIDDDDLESLIDHPKRGIEVDGSIVSIDFDRGSSVATVNFSSPSDVKKLLQKGVLEYKRQKMLVKKPVTAHPSAVLLTGICDATDNEIVELYFSNPKKSGGNDIVEMKFFEPVHGFAVIIYADEKDAKAVIEKKFHEVRKRQLVATQWIPGEEKKLCQVIQVSNVQVLNRKEETFTSLNDRSFSNYSEGSSRAQYSDCSSMPQYSEWSSRSNESYPDRQELSSIDEPRSDSMSKVDAGKPHHGYHQIMKWEKEGNEEEEEEEVKSCAILVQGVPSKTKEETIKRFFQSRSMSGGGPIESVSQRDDGTYIIVFEDRACVDRVLKRDNLSLDDNSITVKEIKAPSSESNIKGPTEPLMVYVYGDLIRLTRDALILYLEEITRAGVGQLTYGAKEGVALVLFSGKFDFQALRREVHRKPVEDVMLGVGRVGCSSTIQVYSVKPRSAFVLQMYFENENYSGGGGKTEIREIGDHAYLIHYENPTIAGRVAGRRQKIEDEELHVAIYYEGLGLIPPGYDTSKPFLKISPHKIIKVDPLVVRYVKETEDVVVKANEFLRNSHGRIDLLHQDAGEIKIICELKEGMDNVRSLAEQWDEQISESVQKIMAAFDQGNVTCLPKFWHEIQGRLQEYKKFKEKTVMIVENEESHTVDVIGPVQSLKDVLQDVERICQEVQEIQEHVTEEFEAPIGKLQVLWKMDTEPELKRQWPKVSVQMDKKAEKLIFKGNPKDILHALKYVQNQMKPILEHEMPMTKLQIAILSSSQGWKHIQGLLKRSELITEIECDTEKIALIGLKNQIKQTEALLKDEIIESTLEISEDSCPAVRGNEWAQFVNKQLDKNKGKLLLEMKQDLSSIKIAATIDQHDQFKECLVNYLKQNTVKKQHIPATSGCMKLLNRYRLKDLKQIEMDFVNFAVQILPQENKDMGQNLGFAISGLAEGFTHAVTKVKDLISMVVSESQVIRQPGLPKFLMSEGSTMILCGVETKCEVVIEVVDVAQRQAQATALVESETKSGVTVVDSVNTDKGVQIKVIIGDLTEHTVDAVVNPANQRLEHKGGLAGALVMKGGQSIQQESNFYIQCNGHLQNGDAMMTKAGTLPAKRIIHTVGPHWGGGRQGEEDCLYDCVLKCLELAQKEDLRSIAFPAIGTGIFGVPVNIATQSIVEAVSDFLCTEEDDCPVKEVHLVDENQATAQQFATALKGKFGTTEKTKRARSVKKRSSATEIRPTPTQSNKADSPTTGSVDASNFKTKEGVMITIVEGEIAKQKTDAIVNSVPSNLNLSSGALSNSIMIAMDDASKALVQAEADGKRGAGVSCGEVVTTEAGNLACRKIFHIVLPPWKNDPATAQILHKALDKILAECHQNGFSTLAIPAIGTGNLRWPAHVISEGFFDAVIRFSQKQVGTQLKKIYFVIYPSDTNSLAGFNGHLQKLGGTIPSSHRRSERKFALGRDLEVVEELAGPSRGAEGGGWIDVGIGRVSASPDVGELQIGNVKLQVTTGDITQETTDAIVNSSNLRLDLTMGGVSQALAKAGGLEFVAECRKAGIVNPNGVAVTIAGNLKCKIVIHFDATSVGSNWRGIIKTCLSEAENRGCRSVTFPALGTGAMGQRPEHMATCMMEAIADFAKGRSTNVNLVRVMIYQTAMLQPYFREMEQVSRGKSSLWGQFKKLIGYGDSQGEKRRPLYYSGSGEGGMLRHSNSNFELGVSLDVYAFDKNNVVQAMEAIDRLWAEQKADQIIGGSSEPNLRDIIKKMDTNEKERIESMGGPKGVRVTVDAKRKAAQIRIQGQLKDASVVESQIRKFLHQMEMQIYEKEDALVLCQFVQWEFEDKPGVYTPYPEEMNGRIEKAYNQKRGRITFLEELEDGGQKNIVLDLVQELETDGTSTVKMRRRDLSKAVGYSLPDHWSKMNQGDRFIKVLLNPTDKEYIDVASAFQKTAGNTILQIERLQNPTLYRRYMVHKTDMEAERPNIKAEQMLWHGTNSTVINNINVNGFNRSYNGTNAVVYGKGVYFARDASYSVNYARPDANGQRCMFFGSVLTGEYCLGNSSMVEPPPKNAAQPNILYDTTVDNVQNPTIFVVYLDTQVYPHYLVTFR